MAEYLDPRDGYKLVTLPDWQAPQPWWIEVPEMATAYISASGCYTGFISNMNPSAEHLHNALWVRPTLPEELPFIDDEPIRVGEPPAYYGNAIRIKPRMRMYATLVYNVDIQIVIPMKPQRITIKGTIDDCVRVPKLTADYLFNTVQTLGFVSDEQKGAVLYHLNYLKVN